jgi:energy-coupling factor transporter ATP-binding protein EcfA2
MNKEIVNKVITNKLMDISFKEDIDLLKGKYKINNLELGTYFIDFGNGDIPLEINDYQEKYISNDYYENPGFLQWNYYLVFLRDSYNEADKKRIEKNGSFTRKFVFTPDELNDYFDYYSSEKKVDTDIVNIWKDKLRKVDLDEVYTDVSYARAIERFLSNEVIKDVELIKNPTQTDQSFIINEISLLKLNSEYRKYPLQRNFNLGQVNLVTGVNGTGKTSFLESIELIIAGKNNRDPSFEEKKGCVEALYNNQLPDQYTPENNAKYRTRDEGWYSSVYKSGNQLYRSFNKYNFFDSDAAFNLSLNSDVKSLTTYLSSIALGAEFNQMQDRIRGFQERLSREQRNKKKEIDDEKERIKGGNETLQNTEKSNMPEEVFMSVLSYSKQIHWLPEFPQDYNDSLVEFNNDYQTARSIVNSLIKLLGDLKVMNLNGLRDGLLKLDKICEESNRINTEIENIHSKLSIVKNEFDAVNRKHLVLVSAQVFFDDIRSFDLWKLDDTLSSLSVSIASTTRALGYFDKIPNQQIFVENITLECFKNEHFTKLAELNIVRDELSKKIENLKNGLDKLQQVVSEIKTYGKQYLTLNTNADKCPLCNSLFSFEDLSARIQNIAQSVGDNVELVKLDDSLFQIKEEIKREEEIIKCVQYIESGMSNLSINEYLQVSLIDIKEMFSAARNRLADSIKEKTKLLQLREVMDDKKLYENDFNRIKLDIESAFPDLEFEYENIGKYQLKLTEVESKKNTLADEIRNAERNKEVLTNTLRELIFQTYPGINYNEYAAELIYRRELLQKGFVYFEEMAKYLLISDNDDLQDIEQRIDKLHNLCECLSKSISSQHDLSLARQLIQKSESRLKQLEPEYLRISKGMEVINDILENHSESKYLAEFIKDNEKEIQEIFRNIHSPQEFSCVTFDVNKNSVLLRKRDDTEVQINKISTGQRSALALSIFLALNKKLKNGPNLILFDDPITYTDDLNILSFLDYLREMIILENRQVIFATANQKLAGLFEKKFMTLGKERFKVFHFER